MDGTANWQDFFRNWPAEIGRRGVLVTSFDEQIPFDDFLTGDGLLLLERRTPDTMGARKVILPYTNITAVKIVDVVKAKVFRDVGFREVSSPTRAGKSSADAADSKS